MGIVISEQCLCFLMAVVLGFFLGLSYEPLRIGRRAFPHGAVWIGLEDFFFCLYCTICLILLCYAYASGVIRWFAIAGTLLGVYFYFLTLGRFIRSVTDRLLRAIRRALGWLKRKCFSPALGFFKKSVLAMLSVQRQKRLLRIQKRAARYDRRMRARLIRGAKTGF